MSKNDKACLTRAELEFSQRFQLQLGGLIAPEVLEKWNGCKAEVLRARCVEAFGKFPEPAPESLLEFVSTVVIPATTKKFIARDNFIVDTSEKAKVKICFLGDNFEENFLGKTEDAIVEITLRYYKLRKGSVDNPIIAEIGGKEKAETTLTEMFSLMEKQPNGEKGALLTNGYANIFYIRDTNGVLWAVHCHWGDGGWVVHDSSTGLPLVWIAGFQVFSRNSSESQS